MAGGKPGGWASASSSSRKLVQPSLQAEMIDNRKQSGSLSESIINSVDGLENDHAEAEAEAEDQLLEEVHNENNNVQSKTEQSNTKYIHGLLTTLESLLDKYIVSGSMATRRRAYNILQQIIRLSMDKELIRKAERMVRRSGMPMEMPPPLPPTEHVPAVDQQLEDEELHTHKIVKPMGAMITSPLPTEEEKQREIEVNKRLEWERKHKEKSEFMNKMKDNAPTTTLLNDPDIAKNGLEQLSSFAEDKKSLHDTMNGADLGSSSPSSTITSSSSSSSSITSDISSDNTDPSTFSERDNMKRTVTDYNSIASAKSSELIARAGSGDAFLGSVLGVGGLDDVLSRIRRRVWIPLAAPPSLLSQLGIRPVRGLLLYGDPGCGKTLLARKLGDILSPARPITIVSGPEIMDKFVGSSEKNLRELFDNPPEIYHEYKKNYGDALSKQALHVIVLDEFDAIARRRGGSGGKGDQGDAGVARDSVVNQLLAKMDGVDVSGVPTLLIGLTNKPSLIDTALMRPGRFEVQIEVPKPRTTEQRIEILRVHTDSMARNGRVLVKDAPHGTAAWNVLRNMGEEEVQDVPTYDELLNIIAVECDGMSGASLAGVARAAASRALERAVTDFAGHLANDSAIEVEEESEMRNSISDCVITQEDFEKAIEDVFESSRGVDDYSASSSSDANSAKTTDNAAMDKES
ncbi:hypothetical protein ACHAXH_008244 [Discostella pseudostelligera]